MENLPRVTTERRLPLDIQLHDYLWDHRFMGRAVLPAVEALQLLARSVRSADPQRDLAQMENGGFERFLYLDDIDGGPVVEISNRIHVHPDGSLTAILTSRNRSPKTAITRQKAHVRVTFPAGGAPRSAAAPSFERAVQLSGSIFEIEAEQIYRDLVPFGNAYQNIRGKLQVAECGAVAEIRSPAFGAASPLGSPFPLDAAFHAACVWGQRFANVVAFPVGFQKRCIRKPTRAGELYRAGVQLDPVRSTANQLVFTLWVYDRDEDLCETVSGLVMQDVSGGRMKPPDWIKNGV
jgi:hypothetical protein